MCSVVGDFVEKTSFCVFVRAHFEHVVVSVVVAAWAGGREAVSCKVR